ncbi:hypothetical protein KJ611_01115 [Patescibacteria group bacterium]|nr:hypothetical protein [Patescibacteria group bacterium]MBU1705285.1 hypothetical protein [Patescibacteria group bacterium]
MSHPHEALLKEYQVAIDHLAPTVPVEVKSQAQQIHDQLLANETVPKEEIIAAMAQTGLAEYPHRHAYEELNKVGETLDASSLDASSVEYQAALANWQKQAEQITQQIDQLEVLKDQDPKWQAEIADKVRVFREGFLITERDPDLAEVKKEIESWQGTLGLIE